MLSKVCLMAGFLILAQVSFATDIIIRKDSQSPPPQPMPNSVTIGDIPVTATIDNTDLTVYFDWAVGDAIVNEKRKLPEMCLLIKI